MNRKFALLSGLVVSFLAHAGEEPIIYPTVESNVSYQQVTGLGFKPAHSKLVYGVENPLLQYGLLWLPDPIKSQEKAPLIVLIHGGCWLNVFDIQHTYPLSTALSRAGYAVWSLEYRRTGDTGGGWPGTFDDIKAGLAYLPKLNEFPVDLTRVVVAGHSAGGHLALLAGSEFPNLQAVVGLAAITDIVEYGKGTNSCQAATSQFMGGDYQAKAGAYDLANPSGKRMHPNTLLLHGDIDSIVPIQQSTLLDAKADAQKGAGHFDWVHPGTLAYQRLLLNLERLLTQ